MIAASLGEHRVRELNDEINKLNKTKSYWDARIVELGGGDASKGRKFYDVEGL
jgi:pre-mRNA-splicing factor ISY1